MGKKILIVDDTMTVRMLQKMILQREGYDLQEASDGAEALMKIEAAPPDLVLLDVMMPKVNGIEVCRQIKTSEKTRSIPVIIVTTLGEQHQVQQAYEAGCDAYVTKPISKVELMDKIKSLLDNRQK